MTRTVLFPSLALCLYGCASVGSGSDAAEEPQPWPVGVYVLTASVVRRADTRSSQRTERQHFTADLLIMPGGFLRLTTGSTVCEDVSPEESLENVAQGAKTFECGGLTYLLDSSEGAIRGELKVTVSEGIRQQRCTGYVTSPRGGRTCSGYEFFVGGRSVDRRLRLQVEQK